MPNRLPTLLLAVAPACAHTTPPAAAAAADPAEAAIDVLEGVATVAGARGLVASVAQGLGVPAAWLDSPEACSAMELLRQPSLSAVTSIRASQATGAPVVLRGSIDLLVCGGASPQPLSPGAILVLAGAIDIVQGSMLLGKVPSRDPQGYGIGCGVLEVVRDLGGGVLREQGPDANGSVHWSTHELTAAACQGAVEARAATIGG